MSRLVPLRLHLLLLAALVLLVASSGGAEAQKIVYVGGSSDRLVSPWGFAMKDWKAPKVLPGDSLVFQWSGEVHSVHKVSAAEYAACTFVKAKQLARNRNYGSYWYKVNWREFGKTLYFSSKANKDCSLGIKVAFVVST